MSRCTYLLKSRHGVYYFRAVLPQAARQAVGLTTRELRLSLRTKDRARAKALVARKAFVMNLYFNELAPWEEDFERRKALYWRGLKMLKHYGEIDIEDEYALDWLTNELGLGGFDLEAYLFVVEQKRGGRSGAEHPATAVSATVGTSPSDNEQATPSVAAPAVSLAPLLKPAASRPLTSEIERFLKMKSLDVRKDTQDSCRDKLHLFERIVSDDSAMPLSSLTEEHIQRYADVMPALPPRVRQSDTRKIAELLTADGPKKTKTSIRAHARQVSEFLKWCEDQKLPVKAGLSTILKPLLRKNKIDAGKRVPLSPEDQQRLFASPIYTRGAFTHSSDYWVPLLGLYTGARQGELCQLHVTDIGKDGQHCTIDINDLGDKKLKSKASARTIPVHPQLIALGFIDFVEHLKTLGEKRLFPNEMRNSQGEFSAFSKRFRTRRDNARIISTPSARKDFHSLRHTYNDALLNCVDEHIVNRLLGHSTSKSSEGIKSYKHTYSMETLYSATCKFQGHLDLSKMAKLNWLTGGNRRPSQG